jgi:hypothetical protein
MRLDARALVETRQARQEYHRHLAVGGLLIAIAAAPSLRA